MHGNILVFDAELEIEVLAVVVVFPLEVEEEAGEVVVVEFPEMEEVAEEAVDDSVKEPVVDPEARELVPEVEAPVKEAAPVEEAVTVETTAVAPETWN